MDAHPPAAAWSACLTAGQVAAFNRVFRGRRDLFDHFGYEMPD